MVTNELIDFLDAVTEKSGDAILPYFRSQLTVADKAGGGVFDPVTEADRAAETVIREAIQAAFPEHGILGEEFGTYQADVEFVWVVDPIDGTRAFICGLPVWGTLIGLLQNGTPVLGVMHQPYTRERFFGAGGKAWMSGPAGRRALQTRATTSLAESILMTTTPALFSGEKRAAYDRVEESVKLARYGTDCYAYAMLAAGQIDLVIETGLQPYDIVALIPVVQGAGGVITNWTGGSASAGGDVVASATQELHERALDRLAAN